MSIEREPQGQMANRLQAPDRVFPSGPRSDEILPFVRRAFGGSVEILPILRHHRQIANDSMAALITESIRAGKFPRRSECIFPPRRRHEMPCAVERAATSCATAPCQGFLSSARTTVRASRGQQPQPGGSERISDVPGGTHAARLWDDAR